MSSHGRDISSVRVTLSRFSSLYMWPYILSFSLSLCFYFCFNWISFLFFCKSVSVVPWCKLLTLVIHIPWTRSTMEEQAQQDPIWWQILHSPFTFCSANCTFFPWTKSQVLCSKDIKILLYSVWKSTLEEKSWLLNWHSIKAKKFSSHSWISNWLGWSIEGCRKGWNDSIGSKISHKLVRA